MSAGTVVSVGEYLDTSYSPDCEWVDGVIVERNVGERLHSLVQGNIYFALRRNYPDIHVWAELRVRTIRDRHRIPDLCATLDDPGTDVLEVAPFLCIEVLSRRDEMSDVLEKLAEYSSIGTPHIWVFDPRRKKAFTFSAGNLSEVAGPEIATAHPEVRLSLEEAFHQ